MIFASLTFLYLFLPANLLFYFLSRRQLYRNVLLTGFSLFFYAWGEPVWVTLLIFSSALDYLNGLIIERHRGRWQAKFALILSLAVNLGLLGLFKYSAFLYENLNALFGLSLTVPTFALPIGISFYTFQTISYTVDVYRDQVKVQHSFLRFLMFVSLYPQLVAGPIVRYQDVAAEIDSRTVSARDLSEGMGRFCVGLFKKVFVANIAGELSGPFLSGFDQLSVAGAWFGAVLYTLQIYYDFSGYSDMAIGLGRLFGFHYPENFNYPYISRTATEFWRRWHMTLGSFFRDYLYIPLGGRRRHPWRNLFLVWFATGFWHGASWNFVLWGLYYGTLIALERLFLGRLLERLPRVVSHLYLLLAVVVGWVLFYFTDFGQLREFCSILFGFAGHPLWDVGLELVLLNHIFWLAAAVACCMPLLPALKRWYYGRFGTGSALVWQTAASLVCLALSTALLAGQGYNPFLYYRF